MQSNKQCSSCVTQYKLDIEEVYVDIMGGMSHDVTDLLYAIYTGGPIEALQVTACVICRNIVLELIGNLHGNIQQRITGIQCTSCANELYYTAHYTPLL